MPDLDLAYFILARNAEGASFPSEQLPAEWDGVPWTLDDGMRTARILCVEGLLKEAGSGGFAITAQGRRWVGTFRHERMRGAARRVSDELGGSLEDLRAAAVQVLAKRMEAALEDAPGDGRKVDSRVDPGASVAAPEPAAPERQEDPKPPPTEADKGSDEVVTLGGQTIYASELPEGAMERITGRTGPPLNRVQWKALFAYKRGEATREQLRVAFAEKEKGNE